MRKLKTFMTASLRVNICGGGPGGGRYLIDDGLGLLLDDGEGADALETVAANFERVYEAYKPDDETAKTDWSQLSALCSITPDGQLLTSHVEREPDVRGKELLVPRPVDHVCSKHSRE